MNGLDEMAGEMRIVDLGERVRQAHRRGVRRRIAAAGVTVVLLAMVGVVAATQLWSEHDDVPAAELDGTVVTVSDSDSGNDVQVNGKTRQRLSGEAEDLTVSPNGEWLAWRESGGYYVADLDGGEPRGIVSAPDSCLAPAWAPDGEPLLLTGDPEGGISWRDSDSGDSVKRLDTDRERASPMCRVFPLENEDGGYDLSYGTKENFEIRVLSPDGKFSDTGVMKEVRDLGDWDTLTALSPDGATACVAAGSERGRCDALIDTREPEVVNEIDARESWFLSDGGLLTGNGGDTLTMRDADGGETFRAKAPKNARILAYFP